MIDLIIAEYRPSNWKAALDPAFWDIRKISIAPNRVVVFHRVLGRTTFLPYDALVEVRRVNYVRGGAMLMIIWQRGYLHVRDCPEFRAWAERMQDYVPGLKVNYEWMPAPEFKTREDYIVIASAIIFIIVVGLMSCLAFGKYYWIRGDCCEYWPFVCKVVVWSAIAAVALLMSWRTIRRLSWRLGYTVASWVALTFAIGLFMNALVICSNAWLDSSPPQRHEVTATAVRAYRDKKERVTDVYLEYRDWQNTSQTLSVRVNRRNLDAIKIGMHFVIETGGGFFGHEWQRSIAFGRRS